MKSLADEFKTGTEHNWVVTPGVGFDLAIPHIGVYFNLSRVRHERNETFGLLTIRVTFRGAQTIYGTNIIHSADFNCSSFQARERLAKTLVTCTPNTEIGWLPLLNELCARVLDSEEQGEPERPLHEFPINRQALVPFDAGGFPLLRRHPTIWFGDGGNCKSYFALYAAISLVQQGETVLYLDWEMDGPEHHKRLEELVGHDAEFKRLLYLRADRPFYRMTSKLQQIVSRQKVTYLICDSLAVAAEPAPETAEAATNYFRALREVGECGSLHLAHITKRPNDDADDKKQKKKIPDKPFGSVFWSNSARSTWYIQKSEKDERPSFVPVAFHHAKSNTGPKLPSFAMMAEFRGPETIVRSVDIGDYPDLCLSLPIPKRVALALRETPSGLTIDELREQIDLPEKDKRSLERALNRGLKPDEKSGLPRYFKAADGRFTLCH